jgi:acyl-CoA reductase-like NAD-dependent aldehyde dehydrogenase
LTVSTKTLDHYREAAERLRISADAFIDGITVPALAGRRFPSISPRDGIVLAEVAECDTEDVDVAVKSARSAFDDGRWSDQAPADRRRILLRLAELVDEHREELALLESLDTGKPISDALEGDLQVAITCIEYFAESINKIYDEVAPTHSRSLATVTREPLGVVGAVIPWNFPLLTASWKVAPALAAGNTVVLKPAEQAPLTSVRLGELATEAGLPPGVLNVVPGFGPTAGAALGLHRDVDAIAFTGSGEVGALFLRYASESNLKQVSLELGGKSPQIVFADAPDSTVVGEAVAGGIFHNAGQVCAAGSRLVVHRSRKEELLEVISAEAARRQPGDPLDPNTVFGALVDNTHLHKVLGYVETGRGEGAVPIIGGSQALIDSGGFYVEPTVFDQVEPEMRIAQEEIFGPVLSVLTFDDVDEAVAIANGTRYGLAASVWTSDLATAHRVARSIRAGTVCVNSYYGATDVTVPFGGYRQSGFGRDQSLHALEKYTQLKTTWFEF